ncbi:MAG: hypothetical protein V8R01_00055 [Bacilli bacterium]
MALIKDRMFLYPVLCDFKDDYIGVQFLTISEGAMLESYDHKTLSVNFFIKLDECNLLSLIEDKRAELLVLCYCSSTKYREIFPLKLGKNALELKSSDVNKMLELAPILVAKQPIPNFYSRNFNVDYKDTKFNIESGNILAIGNQKKIFVEKEINDMTVINSVITIVRAMKMMFQCSLNMMQIE